MVSNKETYKKLCETEGDRIPLFLQYWWMDAVCYGKQWDVALAYSKDGSVIGALPYLIGSKFGLRYIVQPQLTQYNGPWYRYAEGLSVRKQLQFQYDVDEQLIACLKELKLAFFSQNFSPQVTNWLPYHWAGYKQTTRYSYRYDDISVPESLLGQMSPKNRRYKIETVMPSLDVENIGSAELVATQNEFLRRQGKGNILSQEFLKRVCDTAVMRGNGVVIAVCDKERGKRMGAAFAVYDSQCAYALVTAYDKAGDAAAVNTCLFWALITTLSGRTKSFDFEGSMDRGVENYFRSFGARPIAYHHIWKINNPLLRPILEKRGI